jgi:HAD superfamily hydrolase (TIGR01549 family)
MKLNKIETIFWDFDGVILDSMSIRDIGFEKVLKNFPDFQVEELISFHKKNGGLSRYVKFRYFFEEIRKEDVSDQEVLKLSEEFSIIMRKLLVDKNLLIQDSLNFITKNHENYKMHIISGSDQNELRYLCENLGLSSFFISILGSPTPKTEIVKETLKKYKYFKNEVIFIGDSINDYEAAMDNKILFMGYNNSELEKKSDFILY